MYAVYLDESYPDDIRGSILYPDNTKMNEMYLICGFIVDINDVDKRSELSEKIKHFLSSSGVRKVNEIKYRDLRRVFAEAVKNEWRRIGKQFVYRDVQREVTKRLLPLYDIIYDTYPNAKVSCCGIAIKEYIDFINKVLADNGIDGFKVENNLQDIIDLMKKEGYTIILDEPMISNLIIDKIRNRILSKVRDEAWFSFVRDLVVYQAVSDLLLRINKFLSTIDEKAILFFDADKKSFDDSIYHILTQTLISRGVPTYHNLISRNIDRIAAHFVQDSNRDFLLQVADLIVSGTRNSLIYFEIELFNKIKRFFIRKPKHPDDAWGYGIKILPWERFNYRIASGEITPRKNE